MARRVEELINEAKALPIEERSHLGEAILDTLLTPEEEEIAAEWAELAEDRIDEIERGLVKTIPIEETLERMRVMLAARDDARRKSSRR